MIKSITLNNFRGIRHETRIELKPITLLFGPNSAGKSTILRAFLYAYELLIRGNSNPFRTYLGGQHVNLGGFENLITDHDLTKTMTIGFELDLSAAPVKLQLSNFLPDDLSEIERQKLEDELIRLPQDLIRQNLNAIAIDFHIKWCKVKKKPIVHIINSYTNSRTVQKVNNCQGGDFPINNKIIGKLYGHISSETISLVTNDDKVSHLSTFQPSDVHPNSSGKLIEFQLAHPSTERDGSYLENIIKQIFLMPKRFIDNLTLKERGQDDYEDNDAYRLYLNVFEFVKSNIEKTAITNTIDMLEAKVILGANIVGLPDRNSAIYISPDSWPEINDEEFKAHYGFTISAIKTYTNAMLNHLIAMPIDIIRLELEKLMYIGPIRSVPERISDFSLLPENTGWAEGLAAWKYLFEKADDKFVDRINDWLSSDDKLNSGYLIKLSRYKEIDLTTSLDMNAAELEKLPEKRRILLVHKKSGLEVHPYDVGMGISQVLPIIIATLITEQNEAPQGGIVLIEQPELHIHPRLQVALGDMFTMQASNPYVNKLFLIETHSEHLMLRLLRRIRETTDNTLPMPSLTLVPDDVAVLYIENKPDGLTITNLEINNDGDFDNNWPNGFFDERSEELF